MLAQVGIILLLGLQFSWAQNPPTQEIPNPPSVPQADAVPAAAAIPELPPLPDVPPEGPVEGISELVAIDEDSLKPTNRDPFAKPKSLIDKELEREKPTIDPSVYIDMRIEAIRRYPLRNYTLVGIIFDVENPKAMVKDQENNMHLLTKNQRIGNQEGLIVKIERGELVVEEKGKLVTIKLRK